MADAHDDKGAGEGGGGNGFLDVLFWLVLALGLIYVLNQFLKGIGINFSGANLPSFASFFEWIFSRVQVFSVFLCLLLFAAILYFKLKLADLSKSHGGHDDHGHDEHAHGDAHESHGAHGHAHAEDDHPQEHAHASSARAHDPHAVVFHNETYTPPLQIRSHGPNKRWKSIEDRMASNDENGWKFAIVDADIILDEMLGRMGFEGKGIADKLKQANKGDFATLDNAWRAHKIRNQIAHEGSGFKLSRSAAEDAIKNYRKVFEEFYFI